MTPLSTPNVSDPHATDAVRYTASGRRVSVVHPDPADLFIGDVAAHLANINRFGGAVRNYSVAQHSVLGAEYLHGSVILRQSGVLTPDHVRRAAFNFLMHDAHEAYLQDIISPIKRNLVGEAYRENERRFDAILAKRFGYSSLSNKSEGFAIVKAIDERMLSTEELHFFGQASTVASALNITIHPWAADYAEHRFLAAFAALKPAEVQP